MKVKILRRCRIEINDKIIRNLLYSLYRKIQTINRSQLAEVRSSLEFREANGSMSLVFERSWSLSTYVRRMAPIMDEQRPLVNPWLSSGDYSATDTRDFKRGSFLVAVQLQKSNQIEDRGDLQPNGTVNTRLEFPASWPLSRSTFFLPLSTTPYLFTFVFA